MMGTELTAMLRTTSIALALLAALVSGSTDARAKTIRGHGTSGSHSGHHYSGHHHGGHYYGGYGYYYSGSYAPYYYPFGFSYAPYYPVYPSYYVYGSSYAAEAGYIDTDVAPEEAAVYLDGEYVGIADNFDGFPNYLPVDPGRHNVTFKAEGYRSVTRQVRVPRGAVMELQFTMSKGEGAEPPAPDAGDVELTLPDRAPADPEANEGGEAEAEPGFVRLRISPADASVYLDGEFFATASQLVNLHGDLRLESGQHRIDVVKPGYKGFGKELLVSPGERQTLTVALEKEAGR